MLFQSLWLLLALAPYFIVADSNLNNFDTLWSSVQVHEQLATSASSQCRNHTRNMLDSLRNATFWAVQMVDSSANIPSGVLEGNIYNFGNFDECLAIDTGMIKGQYCLASIQLDGPKLDGLGSRPVHDAKKRPDSFLNAWYYIQNRGERWRASRNNLKMAICVPTSCSHLEVQKAMKTAYTSKLRLLNVTVAVDLTEKLCSVNEPLIITPLDRLFLSIVGLFAIIAIFATWCSYSLQSSGLTKDTKNLAAKMFLCFDLRQNFLNLAKTETKSETDLNFLFGIRLFAIIGTITSHKFGDTFGGPNLNPNVLEQAFSKFWHMPLLHGDLVVDTFFFLGGFLLTEGLLRALNNPDFKSKVSFWSLFLNRFVRLTPAFLMTILFSVSVLPKLGSGPLWKVTVVPESDYCRENWWTNLLYVNNYVHVEKSCIIQGWYVPCDMHFFLVGMPLLMLLHRRPKIGFGLLALFTFTSILAPFLAIWNADADPTLLFFFDFLSNPRAYHYFSNFYVKSHLRGSPYFIGIIFGYIYNCKKESKLGKSKSVLLLMIGLITATITSYSLALFYHTEGVVATSALVRALYGALHRPIWASSTGLIILAISLGRLTMLNKVLGWEPLVPLSKLAYGAFLVHLLVFSYGAGTIRGPTYNSFFIIMMRLLGDLGITFTVALIMYLLVEAPIRNIIK